VGGIPIKFEARRADISVAHTDKKVNRVAVAILQCHRYAVRVLKAQNLPKCQPYRLETDSSYGFKP
jgi:hypothetical protein